MKILMKGEFLIEILGLKGINVAKLGIDSLVFWATTKGNFGSVVQVRVWNFLVQRDFIP